MLGKKKGIKESLKNYMENVTIDVFGYEKKVISNVHGYFQVQSKNYRLSKEDMIVEIGLQNKQCKARLITDKALLYAIPTPELIDFFAGEGMAAALGLQPIVEKRVSEYLQHLAIAHAIPTEKVNAKIQLQDNLVKVFLCYGEKYHSLIPLKTLIKQFKP